jgi:hypothetical protein
MSDTDKLELIVRFYVSDKELRDELLEDLTALINRDYIAKEEVLSALDKYLGDVTVEEYDDGSRIAQINPAREKIKTKLGLEK